VKENTMAPEKVQDKPDATVDNANMPQLPPSLPAPTSSTPPTSSHSSSTSVADIEAGMGLTKEEIERLGRERPEVFKSRWSEIGFVFSICMSQLLTVCYCSICLHMPLFHPTF
jgi:hypothetical protein